MKHVKIFKLLPSNIAFQKLYSKVFHTRKVVFHLAEHNFMVIAIMCIRPNKKNLLFQEIQVNIFFFFF